MRGALAQCAAAALLAAAPYVAHTASDPTAAAQRASADATLSNNAARCAGLKGALAEACASRAAATRPARRDEARTYVAATSTRLRNRAYLRAAARYCDAYHGRVRSACFDEAAAMFGDSRVQTRPR